MECLAAFVGHAGWQTGLPPFRAIPRALGQILLVRGAPGEEWEDEYREQVLALIERKAAGEEIAVQEVPEAAPAEVPDLMSALQASLDAVRGGDSGGAKKRKAPASASASRQKASSKG